MLYLLALLCPPLASWLAGSPRQALGTAGLTLLLYVPGVLHALAVVDRYYIGRRNQALLRAVQLHYA